MLTITDNIYFLVNGMFKMWSHYWLLKLNINYISSFDWIFVFLNHCLPMGQGFPFSYLLVEQSAADDESVTRSNPDKRRRKIGDIFKFKS
jgi:hypothetical protein